MNAANERRLGARATALGNSADADALPELIGLTKSESPLVRRLAASAMGKLAGIATSGPAVSALQPLLQDDHPQVRQYAAKALGGFGIHAKSALQDLRDLYANPAEKAYVKRSVLASGKCIRKAVDLAEKRVVRHCRRCNVAVDPDEYARSMRAFDRPFCDKCFDETYLERRNFDTKVELNKTVIARDGTLVQSQGERIIAELLGEHQIEYRYDERIRIVQGLAIRPDFYLPEFDIYIEYWGMDTIDYKMGMLKKRKLYQQQGKRLVSVYFSDMPDLKNVLLKKLEHHIRIR